MRNCDELSKLLSEGMDRPLSFREKMEIIFHASMCPNCRQFGKNTKNLHQLMLAYREQQKRGK